LGSTLGEQGNQYLECMIEGAARMERLLRGLQMFTQTLKTSEAEAEVVDANEVLTESLANLNAAIQQSGAVITQDPLPPVRVHRFQLEQLFQNLIGNAIRYRSEKRPEIHVAAERRDGMWQFSVRDNGLGIDPEYREQIFGMFKRLHSAAEYPGTGLGLAICERIVERAGGRIWVESHSGRGSTFLFTLPTS
jgi:light-regulated signal transduction histidine kinase (bacteriophytochrome)